MTEINPGPIWSGVFSCAHPLPWPIVVVAGRERAMLVSVFENTVIVTWGERNQFRTTYTYSSREQAVAEARKLADEIDKAGRDK